MPLLTCTDTKRDTRGNRCIIGDKQRREKNPDVKGTGRKDDFSGVAYLSTHSKHTLNTVN